MSFKYKKHFTDVISRDFFNLMAGEFIGDGMSRAVYQNRFDPTTVLKIESRAGQFQNIAEFQLWQEWQLYKPIGDWLAPVDSMSNNGIVLVMKKTTPILPKDFPLELPAFLRDVKIGNFGMYEGRVVCHDYGVGLNLNKQRGNKKYVLSADGGHVHPA